MKIALLAATITVTVALATIVFLVAKVAGDFLDAMDSLV